MLSSTFLILNAIPNVDDECLFYCHKTAPEPELNSFALQAGSVVSNLFKHCALLSLLLWTARLI